MAAPTTARGGWLDPLLAERQVYVRGRGHPYFVTVTRRARTLRALALLALLRGRLARAAVAVAIVACSVVTAEALKHGLPSAAGRAATFPSGHTAIAVSLGLALVAAVPQALRPVAALVGAAYGAAIAFSVVALGWHYPSDAIGSFFVCGLFASLGALALRSSPRRPSLSGVGSVAAVGVVALSLVLAAAVASRHPVAVAAVRSRPAVAAAAAAFGVLSIALFALVTPLFSERPR